MAVEISLNCWILGLDKANRFSVDVPLSKTVDHLKKAIKKEKENAFNHIDADQLEIWKLRNPLRSGDIAKTLGKINADKGIPNADELDAEEDLSHYFTEPPVKRMIHLIVRVPPEPASADMASLACCVLGLDDVKPFLVDIPLSKTVDHLKKAIKKENENTLNHIDAHHLEIWKLRNPLRSDDIAKTLADKGIPDADELDPVQKLSRYFLETPVEAMVHLVIQAPPAVPRSRRLSIVGPLDYKAIIGKHVQAAKAKKPPSTGATPSTFPATQAKDPILNGRPFATRSTPVHLYHDVFTTFTSVYDDTTRKIPLDIQNHIFKLCHDSSELYKTVSRKDRKEGGESIRLKTILPLYRLILGEPMQSQPVVGGEADVAITTTMGDGQLALRGNFEFKNEIGAGGCDPNLQGPLSYIKYWAMDGLEATRETCCCPSFVIAVPGPWIAVHGAVLTDAGWVFQPLTDLVNLQFDPYNHRRMLNLARLFLALRESLQELDIFYKTIKHQKASVLWPSIRAYKGIQFKYLERLLPECLSKAVFKAQTLLNNEMIVVKFTDSYSADAHRLLEREHLAPPLRYFSGDDEGFNKPGGLEMVVMDFIPENSDASLSQQGRKDVRHALDVLHQAGYVFGDLRLANILNLQDGHAMLIDFDWSGPAEQVFYPMGLNEEIEWPATCGAGTPIRKEDDLFMFEQL